MSSFVRLVLWILLALAVLLLMFAAFERGHCWYAGWTMERETKYAPFVGCLTRSGDRWIPLNSIREVD